MEQTNQDSVKTEILLGKDIDDGVEKSHPPKKNISNGYGAAGDILLEERDHFSNTSYRMGFSLCTKHEFSAVSRMSSRDPIFIYCNYCGATVVTTPCEK
jgi:hypothetical protein